MSVQEFVENSIADNEVVIYSKSYCNFCRSAKKLFGDKFPDAKVVAFELDEREDGVSIQQYLHTKTGQSTVPNVFVNKHHIGGYDNTRASFESGELAQFLTK